MLFNKNQAKIDDFHIIQDGMLVSFLLQINTEQVRILSCYALSAGDEPEFFYQCKDVLNLATEKHGIIVGDFNTTLHPILDRKNDKTYTHKKSRLVINNWIANEEMFFLFLFTNGSDQIWTYQCKETHDQTLKGRIDYVLGTPV